MYKYRTFKTFLQYMLKKIYNVNKEKAKRGN